MFYHPHFCCHCGEKIVRAKWTPLTSRRFCEFCAIEQKQHDLIPRAAAVIILLFGAAGLTAYFGGGSSSREPVAAKIRQSKNESVPTPGLPHPPGSTRASVSPPLVANAGSPLSEAPASNTKQRVGQPNSSTGPVYYCGAMTKKGTPCTRRVKLPGRCWQHPGQPAMDAPRN
ncbi:MAG: hypothetical protein ABI857_05945 [Acidobacteriota bacterium]